MEIKVAECCLTCCSGEFEIIAQKKNNKISTGFSSNGKCYNRGIKNVNLCHLCERYKKRDDIFSAEKLNLNKEEEEEEER